MIARALPALVMMVALAGAALAQAPAASPRPEARPAATVLAPIADAVRQALGPAARRLALGLRSSPRPEARPEDLPRPELRPGEQPRPERERRAAPTGPVTAATGPICGDRAIRGVRIEPIRGRLTGCGIARPVRVTAVAGVSLSQAATIDCPTARALKSWVQRDVKRLVGRRGGGAVGLRVVAHYSCRARNNRPGARLSEHSLGHAIDVAAIQLDDGTELSVLEDWSDPGNGRLMKRLHRAACGRFGTVLGPASDRYHRNHFHLDTARYRSGSYCR